MYLSEYLYYSLVFIIIFPTLFLGFVPLYQYLKYPAYITIISSVAVYALLFLAVRPILILSNGHNLLIMIPVLLLIFLFYNSMLNIDILKSALLYLWAIGFMSFSSSIANVITLIAYLNGQDLSDGAEIHIVRILIAFIIAIILVILTYKWNDDYLKDPAVPNAVFISFLSIPVIMLYINTIIISYEPSANSQSSDALAYTMIIVGMFLLSIFLTQNLYSVSRLYIERSHVSEEKRILEIQASQYNDLTREVDRTSKFIHDYKHTLSTLKTLAISDKATNVMDYLDTLGANMVDISIKNYCSNQAINSVLNHYVFMTNTNSIPLSLQIDIPEKLPMNDAEFCSMIGNLMENAIDACKEISQAERSFKLSIVMKQNNLFIVSSNSFSGNIKPSGDSYLSTKHSGYGIGLHSITDIVNRYGGDIMIKYDEHTFYLDIVINFIALNADI